MEHHFNIQVAIKFGVDGAIIIHNIYFWVKKNEANKRHFINGSYWTYNSIEAFTKLFPYYSKRQIERIINNLLKAGAILKDNFNTSSYDRTSWYTLTEIVKCIYANGEMDSSKPLNGFTQTVSPIPDSNTDSKNKEYKYPFITIFNFEESLNSFTLNKSYFYIAYRFWELWWKDNETKTLKDAEVKKWYDAVRLIIETDNQKIERLISVFEYFKKCQVQESGFKPFWYETIKSIGSFRKKDKEGVYYLDKVMEDVNRKIQTDKAFSQLVFSQIEKFKNYERSKLLTKQD